MFGSTLLFSGLPDVGIQRYAVTASGDYRLSPTNTLGVGLGAGLGGLLTVGPRRFQVLPGWELTLTYSHRFLDGRGNLPFLVLGLSAGGSGASTREEVAMGGVPVTPGTEIFYAFDFRAGITIGKTFWDTLSPYAAARAFGGPVLWRYDDKGVNGTDRYHYQVGAGLVMSLARGFDVFVEGVPLGERAVTLGGGKTF
jgi:hypothetical protein